MERPDDRKLVMCRCVILYVAVYVVFLLLSALG